MVLAPRVGGVSGRGWWNIQGLVMECERDVKGRWSVVRKVVVGCCQKAALGLY